MLRWMQASLCVSAGLTLTWGLSSVGWAGPPIPQAKPQPPTAAVTARAAVDAPRVTISRQAGKPFTVVARKPLRTAQKVVRGQNDFEIEQPSVVAPIGVVPPPAPTELVEGYLDESQSEALKRLKDRSVKERWEKIHQEWLENRKKRDAQPTPVKPADPAAESTDPANSENPFEGTTPQVPVATERNSGDPAKTPDSIPTPREFDEAGRSGTLTPAVPTGEGVTRPEVPPDKVFLQSQQKPPQKLPTDEELTKMLNDDNGQRLPPPVRDPGAMPKITDIIPNPKERSTTQGRSVPEQDAKQYVALGDTPYTPRAFPEFTYNYESANVWANPLYFEDPHLERYGHTMHPLTQPIASTFLFALQLGGLPYQMAINPPNEKMYPLGWYLPGDNVPYRMRQIPLSLKGAAVETGVILGTQFATP